MKIKALALILVCLMILPLAVSCKKDTPTDETTTPAVSETDPLEEKLLIASDGKSEYKIIRSEYVADTFYNKYVSFLKDIKDKTGAYFQAGDDFLRKDMDKSAPLEIIFGKANRPECKELYASISYDGYAVKHIGNKIIIAAYQPAKMIFAVKAFLDECIELVEEDGVKKVYYVKDITVEGTEKPFFNTDNPISDYKIIYAEEAKDAAKSLAKLISTYTDTTIECHPDSTAVSDKEILIGDTNREESKGNDKISKIGFLIKTAGTKVVIRSGNVKTIANAVNVIAANYMRVSPDFNFPASLNTVHTSYEGTDRMELTEGADFRVMSFNILSEEWAEEAKDIEARVPGVVGCISYYEPDVIGIQEVSVKWYGLLKEYLGDTYEFVNTDANGTKNGCYTGLAYNKNTVRLIEKELTYYSVYNSKRLRVINMGLFEMIETGKRLVVTDTHFNANHKDAATENKNRVKQATEFIAKIDSYRKKYNCPIIMTGDFNSKDGTEPYNVVVSDPLITETKYTAKEKGSIFLTYHAVGTMPGSATESIDHIFSSGAVTPLYYTTLIDAYLVKASDHCPIFCDFKFN